MKEIRIDKLTGDKVIYVSFRSKRPHDKLKSTNDFYDEDLEYNEKCPFCRGNEDTNGDIKEVIDGEGGWIAKSVANKFPIVDMESNDIFGEHEVIIENFRHNAKFFDMTIADFKNFLELYKNRFSELKSKNGIEYVSIFKNYKRGSGASLMHPHSQIISLSEIPPEIEKEARVAKKFKEKNNSNLYEHIVETESQIGDRVIYEGRYFLVYVPEATRYNGEIRIIQKVEGDISSWVKEIIEELAYVLKNLFIRIEDVDGDIPFNLLVHSSYEGKNLEEIRTHIHIVPRKYNFGGFELCTNLFVCGSDPKELAKLYRFK